MELHEVTEQEYTTSEFINHFSRNIITGNSVKNKGFYRILMDCNRAGRVTTVVFARIFGEKTKVLFTTNTEQDFERDNIESINLRKHTIEVVTETDNGQKTYKISRN